MSDIALPFASSLDEFPDTHGVYIRDGESVEWAVFSQRIRHWAAVISTLSESKLAVYHSDGGEFLAILMAAWHCGRVVVLPPNNLPSSISSIAHETSIYLGEFGDHSYQCDKSSGDDAICYVEQTDTDLALLLYTSGSTGEPTAVSKTFAQLNAEANILEQKWGASVADLDVVATVSHQHEYGLIFKCLWPLLKAKRFHVLELRYLEGLPDISVSAPVTLVCSPAHLANIPASIDWSAIKGRVKQIFCAGAPLLETAALAGEQAFYCKPTEIYGSTETGVIAWRHQLDGDQGPIWQVFEGIQWRSDDNQQLAIQSPSLADEHWFLMADKVEPIGDSNGERGFSLCGRVDKIVKVAGKRVSLSEIERLLTSHEWVKSARVIPHIKRKSRLAAVVSLNPAGNAFLIDQGERATWQQLSQQFTGQLERVVYPRYWRFVLNLPVNKMGKTTAAELNALFDTENPVKHAEVLSEQYCEQSNSYETELFIPYALTYLNGHFAGNPVLPGVVQLTWVAEIARRVFGGLEGSFSKLEQVKFRKIMRPGDKITLRLSFDEDKNKVQFSYNSGDDVNSSGRFVFVKDVS